MIMTTNETGEITAPDYLEALSLYCAPYENRLDPKFFYASTALMQRLDLLTHLTQFGESVVVVTGPPGSGKTTLISRFLAQASSQWRLCLLDAGQINQLPGRLARALGVDTSASESELVSQWASETDASQLLVLIIDNAERLDQAACNRLCGLLGEPQGDRLRIILFGSQDIQERVKQALEERACSRTTQILEVPRFSAEETASYLMYRLAVAGYSGESPFTTTEVRAICKAADGRPALINRLAHDALLEHGARAKRRQQLPSQKPGRRRGPLWLSASLGILVVATYVGWQRLSSSLENVEQLPELASITPQQEIPLTLPKPPARTNVFSDSRNRALPSSRAEAPVDPAATSASEAVPAASQQATAALPDNDVPQAEQDPGEPAVTTVATLQQLPPAELQAEIQPDAEQPPQKQAVADLATAEPEQPTETEKLAATPSIQTETVVATARSDGHPHREDWLLQQPAKLYSLQLLGSRSEKSVTRFIKDNALDLSQTAYYRGSFKDSAWFVLLYGLYPSRDEALKAREGLPAAVRKGKPWPRSLESVHSAIGEIRP